MLNFESPFKNHDTSFRTNGNTTPFLNSFATKISYPGPSHGRKASCITYAQPVCTAQSYHLSCATDITIVNVLVIWYATDIINSK